ncbi:MAG: hypothetical protein IV110_12410 [Aquabacterium sp.]|uniref:hypothetical protein n=1 Tax=Aquabacterium sp. TaxID=1872578 RepID=UPI001D1B4B3B|nr:hypothetical protein [Aquabacterium sp.]MBT9610830.1 hypothetical protein [Aquabacterium sp.]
MPPTDSTPRLPSQDATPHWLIPFAASLSEPCQHALPHLDAEGRLPNLRALASRLSVVARSDGDEYALSMPHERVLAAALGWPVGPDTDGRLPWAHWWAAQDGLHLDADACWALLSPGHWLMGREHLTLLDPNALGLDAATSQALLEALRPLFEEDGWQLRWGAPTRWYASHPLLDGLPTASLDRVVGRNPDLWLSADAANNTAKNTASKATSNATRTLRRLQAEVQMSLYQHPLNDRREAEGRDTVNSFWVSGCGRLPSGGLPAWPAGLTLCDDLRAGLLCDDMPVWVDAWQHLDATVLAHLVQRLEAGQPLRLTLCGERHAVTLGTGTPDGGGFMGTLKRSLKRPLQALRPRRAAPLPSAILAPL